MFYFKFNKHYSNRTQTYFMKDNFIENKLKDHICRFNDGEHNCDCYIAGVTDYHNHIVEKIEKLKRDPQDSHDLGYDTAVRDTLSLLQDTNQKE